MTMKTTTCCAAALALAWLGYAASAAAAAPGQSPPPANPDPGMKYLFYMHGQSVETNQPVEGVPVEYEKILQAFADRGFVAIGERRGTVKQGDYARKIAGQ